MRISRAVTALALVGVAGVMVASMGTAHANNAAFILKDFGCGMFDGDGGFVLSTDGNISINTHSGHTTLICKAKGAANSTGKAVKTTGFLCGTILGLTNDSQNTVSASGNITLRCRI